MEKPAPKRSFLGRGWSFPPSFLDHSESLEMVEEEEDIKQSLYLLISTIPGERIMKPKYGCDLHKIVFKQLTSATRSEIIDMVSIAILRYEPRITVEEIQVEMSNEDYGMISITVIYEIRKTNSRDNIVYPFYFKEGTNVQGM